MFCHLVACTAKRRAMPPAPASRWRSTVQHAGAAPIALPTGSRWGHNPDIDRDPGLSALVLNCMNAPLPRRRAQVIAIDLTVLLLGLASIVSFVARSELRRGIEQAGRPAQDHVWDAPINSGGRPIIITPSTSMTRTGLPDRC